METLLTLSTYLTQTPKKTVSALFKRLDSAPTGIISNQKVIGEVTSHFLKRNEELDLEKNINHLAIQLLKAIYLSGNRGLSEPQIFSLAKKYSKEEVLLSLRQLKKNLWIYSGKKTTRFYYGFDEFKKKGFGLLFSNF